MRLKRISYLLLASRSPKLSSFVYHGQLAVAEERNSIEPASIHGMHLQMIRVKFFFKDTWRKANPDFQVWK